MTKLIFAAFLCSALSTMAMVAHAQPQQPASTLPTPAELATRRQLIQQALQEAEAHHPQRALELGEQAARIQTSASLLLLIVEQQVALGRFGDALGNAERCGQLVRDPNHVVQDRAFTQQGCDRFVQTLPSRVGHVTVVIGSNAPADLHVTVAGNSLSANVYNLPYIVNPGRVHVQVDLGNQSLLLRDVMVPEGGTISIPVIIPERSNVLVVPVTPAYTRPLSPGPIVVIAVSVVGFLSSAITGVVRENTLSQLRSMCTSTGVLEEYNCSDVSTTRALISQGQTLTTTTNVLLGVSAAVTAAGIAWLIVDRATASRPAERRNVYFVPTHNGFVFQGAF